MNATYGEAYRRGAEKIYWQAQADNRHARALYEQIAEYTGYVVYARPQSD